MIYTIVANSSIICRCYVYIYTKTRLDMHNVAVYKQHQRQFNNTAVHYTGSILLKIAKPTKELAEVIKNMWNEGN